MVRPSPAATPSADDPMHDATRAPRTLHQRILGEIEGRIVSGEWPPGTRIPFEVDLARHYACSRMTVNKVLSQLARAGLIERRKRSGSFVSKPRAQSAVLEIHSIEAEVRSLGLPYSYRLAARRVRPATAADRERLAAARGARLLHLLCRHDAGGRPFCLEDRLIDLTSVPHAEDADFAAAPPGPWLLAQVPWSEAEHLVRAIAADAETARALAIPAGSACLVVERRTWNASGAITQVRLVYPGDSHVLCARFTPSQAG